MPSIKKSEVITHRDDIAVCYDEHKLTGCTSTSYKEVIEYDYDDGLAMDGWIECMKCGRTF